MDTNFYATLAQVLPVLLLALIWDSAYLVRLRRQRRLPRRVDPCGVWFWTKPRVRIYTLTVVSVVMASIGLTMLVLAGLLPDSRGLRIALTACLGLLLATLMTRISVDVILATATGTQAQSDNSAADSESPAASPTREAEDDQ